MWLRVQSPSLCVGVVSGRGWLTGSRYVCVCVCVCMYVRSEWKITREAAAPACTVTLPPLTPPTPCLDQAQHSWVFRGKGEVPNRFLNIYTHKKCSQGSWWGGGGREGYTALPYAIFTISYAGLSLLRGRCLVNPSMVSYKWIHKE
jgi:hypothetical protein